MQSQHHIGCSLTLAITCPAEHNNSYRVIMNVLHGALSMFGGQSLNAWMKSVGSADQGVHGPMHSNPLLNSSLVASQILLELSVAALKPC